MTDADIVREALHRFPWRDRFERSMLEKADAALDRLVALSCVHVTQASHDLLVAEGWLDPDRAETASRLLELAWGVIANAAGGNWERERAEWREAAERWRDEFEAFLDAGGVRVGEEQRT